MRSEEERAREPEEEVGGLHDREAVAEVVEGMVVVALLHCCHKVDQGGVVDVEGLHQAALFVHVTHIQEQLRVGGVEDVKVPRQTAGHGASALLRPLERPRAHQKRLGALVALLRLLSVLRARLL